MNPSTLDPRPPSQRKLVLPGERTTLVLATVASAREQLPGHTEDDVTALIEEGHLLHAWNIGLGQARDIRIWPECISHYLRTAGSQPSTINHQPSTRRYPRTLDQVIAQMLQTNKPYLTSSQLRLLLNCGPTHILHLVEAGALSLMPGTTYTRGPQGAALITIQSLKAFFQNRLA